LVCRDVACESVGDEELVHCVEEEEEEEEEE
jgi:hypothetical protein